MKGSEIIERVSRSVDKINRLAAVVERGYDMEDIRRFRTEIKRIRAFLRLCQMAGIGELRLPSSIERFYAGVGAIRDLQLHLERSEAYFTREGMRPEGYFGILRQELAFRKAQAVELRNNTAGSSLADGKGGYEAPVRRIGREGLQNDADPAGSGSKLGHAPPGQRENAHTAGLEAGLDKMMIKKYVRDLKKRLSKALKKEKEDVALHRLRKLLKDIRYNQPIMEKILKKPVPGLPDRPAIREMTSLLGVHQDLCVALQYSKKTYTGSLEKKEKGELRQMKQWLRREKARVITQIIVKLEHPQFRPLYHRTAK